jgi:hypothetical protein
MNNSNQICRHAFLVSEQPAQGSPEDALKLSIAQVFVSEPTRMELHPIIDQNNFFLRHMNTLN